MVVIDLMVPYWICTGQPIVNDAFDTKCGTSHISEYAAGGSHECSIDFFASKNKDTDFEECLHVVDNQMHYEMYSEAGPNESDEITLFMQQMIPHHVNAVNMAKLLLKQASHAERIWRIFYIINSETTRTYIPRKNFFMIHLLFHPLLWMMMAFKMILMTKILTMITMIMNMIALLVQGSSWMLH